MFNMSNLLITLQSSKKSYTFPLSDTSPYSVTSNFPDMFPRQNRVGKSTFFHYQLFLFFFFFFFCDTSSGAVIGKSLKCP